MDSLRLLRRVRRVLPIVVLALLPLLAPVRPASAEGSLTLVSSGGSRPYFEYRNDVTQNSTLRRLTRVFVYANPGESLLVASSANGVGNGHLRYVAPNGATGHAPIGQVVQGKTVGMIADVTQEQAGPLPASGGFRPWAIVVGAGQGGVWELRFASPDSTSTSNPPTRAALAAWGQIGGVGYVSAWDVTVRSAAGAAIGGRVWVDQFAMNVGGPSVSMSSQFYVLTRDGFQYRVDANGVQPFGFNFFANNKGFRDAGGVPLYHSVALAGSNIQNPDAADTPSDVTHKLFLTQPALDLPASAPSASGTEWIRLPSPFVASATNLTFTGVDGTPNQAGSGLGGLFRFDSDGNANYTLSIDLDGNGVFTDAIDRQLVGVAVAGSNSIAWDGRNGLGAPAASSGSPSQVRARVQMQGGEVHFPYADAEDNPVGLVLERQNGLGSPDYTVYFDDRPLGGSFALPPAGANSTAGAHTWNGAFGDIRGMDTWTFVPGAVVQLGGAVVIRNADLEMVSKTHAPEPLVTGAGASYTFVVRNNGPDSAYAAAVIDTIPGALGSLSAPTPLLTGGAQLLARSITGQVFEASVTLPPLATATFTVNGTVSGAATSPVLNRAFVLRTDDSGDLDDQSRTGAGNNGKRDTATVVAGAPDLTLDKRHTADFSAGSTGTYTLVVRNVGTAPTTGAIAVTDTLPAGLAYATSAGAFTAAVNGAIVTLTSSTPIAAGDSAVITLVVTVAAGAIPQVVNSATVSGGGDTNPANDRDSDPTAVGGGADLAIDKSHDAPLVIGLPGAYTIAVTNVGTAPTTGAFTVTDTLPAGLHYVSATGGAWSFGVNGAIVTAIHAGTLAPGDTASFVLGVLADSTTFPAAVNAASVAGGGDTNPANDRDTDPTLVVRAPDLVVTKSHAAPFLVGGQGVWTVRVENIGPGATVGDVTVRDTIPAGLVPQSAFGAGWGIAIDGQVVTAFTTDPIDPGVAGSFDIIVQVTGAAVPGVVNSATVTGGSDPNTGNNRASDPTPVTANPDLVVDKRHDVDMNVDVPFTWSFIVSNLGAAASTGAITVRDTLPAGVTYVSGGGTGWTVTHANGEVTAVSSGPIAPGDSTSFAVTVIPDESAWPGVNNSAWVSGGGDANPDNNGDFDPTPFTSDPDLVMHKTSTSAFVVGGTGTYDLAVTNLGTSPSVGTITVTDTLPAGLTYVSGSGTGWTVSASGQVVTAVTSQTIFAGFFNAKHVTLTVAVGAAAQPAVTNFAEVAGGGDLEPRNNRDGDTTAVGSPDLTIDKRHTQAFTAGQNGTYRLVVRNIGAAATAGAITVRDTLPAGLTYVSAGGGSFNASAAGQVVTLTRSTAILAGDSAAVTLNVSVSAAAAPSVTNSATVSGGGDVNPGNNRDSDPTAVSATPDLALAKANVGAFLPGGTANWTLTVSNVGTAPTSGTITVRDTLPAGLSNGQGSGTGWTVVWNGNVMTATTAGVIPIAATSTIALSATLDPLAPSPVINAAEVSGGGDTTPPNNRGIDTTDVTSQADLAIAKTHANPFVVGSTSRWTITVTNVGTTPTTGTVTVRDTLPAGIGYVLAQGTGWAILQESPLVAQFDAVLGPNASTSLTLDVTAGSNAVPTVTNVAWVSGGGDTNPANDRASDPTAVTLAPDLAIQKTTKSTFRVGDQVTYDLVVTNVGSAVTTGAVTVVDTLPTGLTYVSAAGNGWSYAVNGQVVTATATSPLGVLATRTISISAIVGSAAIPGVTNTAEVAGGGDLNPANNRSTITNIFGNGPDLAITKRHTGGFGRGLQGHWVLGVSNRGVQPTTGTITVSDALPSGATYAGATGDNWTFSVTGQQFTATRTVPMAVNDTSTIFLDVLVSTTAPASMQNTATVATPGDVNVTNNAYTDGVAVSGLTPLVVEKSASPEQVEIGGVVDYRIVVKNLGATPVANVSVTDVLPPGFTYVAGSARRNGVPQPDPMGSPGPSLTFDVGTVVGSIPEISGTVTITYRVAVGVGAGTGDAVNTAVASSPDGGVNGTPVRSNTGAATVKVLGGVFGDLGIVAGKVWSDCDCAGDGRQGAEEVGIPGVRVTLEDGTSAITDAEGRYSFTNVRPRLHVLRVDTSTLPPGAKLLPVDTRNAGDGRSRFVDLKAGEFHRADFVERSQDAAVREAIRQRRTKGEPWAAMSESDSGHVEFAPAQGFAEAKTLELVVPEYTRRGLGADGRSALGVGVKVPAGKGNEPVTLEASAGEWIDVDGKPAPDLDPTAAGLQTQFDPAQPNPIRHYAFLRAPAQAGDVKIRVTQGEASDSATVRFVTPSRPLLVSGLVEARLDARLLDAAKLKGMARDRFEDALVDASFDHERGARHGGARGAVFARGDLGNGVQLTGRWDSENDPDRRLFRDIRPFEGYDVVGDASQHEWDARSTSRLFVRLDKDASFAQFGDYATPLRDEQKLGAFMRSLNGGLARLAGRYAEVGGFVAEGRTRQVVDEIRGLGVSGPYALSRTTGVLNSEQVELVTRDRNQPSRILSREPQQRFTDYVIEPYSGALMFRRPVPGFDGDLNPVSIRVTYETDGTGDSFWTYGGSLAITPDPRVKLGFSGSRDEDPSRPGNLASADLVVTPMPGVRLAAEYARSDSGTAFLAGDRHGQAWRAELAANDPHVNARVWAQRAETGFDNPSSAVAAGRQELGANVRVPFPTGTSVFATAIRTEDLATNGRRDGVDAGLAQKLGPFTAEGAYRFASETASRAVAGTTGVWPSDVGSVRGKLSVLAPLPGGRRATLFGEFEQDLDRSERRRGGGGAELPVSARTRVYLKHEDISSFSGPFALNDRERASQTVFGVASDELREGHVFSEYRARSAFAGRDAEAAMGLRNRWTVAPGVRLEGSFEQVQSLKNRTNTTPPTGSAQEKSSIALGGGIEATNDPLGKATGRVELRFSDNSVLGKRTSVLGTLGLARKLNRDWAALARTSLYNGLDDESDLRTQFGVAWRQTEANRWNALARFENRTQKNGRSSPQDDHAANVLSAHVNVKAAPSFTLSGQTAAKWANDHAGTVASHTDAQLFALRGLWDLGSRFDAGVMVRSLTARNFAEKRFGAGAELGVLVGHGLRASAGWNVFGFRDKDLADLDHTDQGPYVQMGFKFDEQFIRDALGRK